MEVAVLVGGEILVRSPGEDPGEDPGGGIAGKAAPKALPETSWARRLLDGEREQADSATSVRLIEKVPTERLVV